jgi:hypothetical protein
MPLDDLGPTHWGIFDFDGLAVQTSRRRRARWAENLLL